MAHPNRGAFGPGAVARILAPRWYTVWTKSTVLRGRLAASAPGQLQQPFGAVAQGVQGVQDGLDLRQGNLPAAIGLGLLDGGVQAQPYRGQGGAQLVRGVGGQGAFHVQGQVQAVQQLVYTLPRLGATRVAGRSGPAAVNGRRCAARICACNQRRECSSRRAIQ